MKTKASFLVFVVAILSVILAPGILKGEAFKVRPPMKQLGFINFGNRLPGTCYTLDMVFEDWNPRLKNGDGIIDFKGIVHNRAFVVNNPKLGGNALMVLLPKEKISPLETGIQIFGYIGEREEVYFGNSIFLPSDFECGREVKTPPGIYGGWKFATGGGVPDGEKVGPSIRAVIQRCVAKSYIYHLNQKGDNDDGLQLPGNQAYGDKFTWRHADGRPVVVSKGAKHEIMFYARMNTPGEKDGTHKVWYDGELVLSLDDLEFRKMPSMKFNTVGVEIFRGGNDQSYATLQDNTLDVSDFRVYVKE